MSAFITAIIIFDIICVALIVFEIAKFTVYAVYGKRKSEEIVGYPPKKSRRDNIILSDVEIKNKQKEYAKKIQSEYTR